jgi:hypothetical protein
MRRLQVTLSLSQGENFGIIGGIVGMKKLLKREEGEFQGSPWRGGEWVNLFWSAELW